MLLHHNAIEGLNKKTYEKEKLKEELLKIILKF